MNSPWQLSISVVEVIMRGVVVYVAILILLRLTGKREIGQMGATEFVSILLVSEAVQNAMIGEDSSVPGGLISAAVVLGLTMLGGAISYHSKAASKVLEGSPSLLIHKGEILWDNLKRERINEDDLKGMLREAGVLHASEVYQAVLESDGHVSVIKKREAAPVQGDFSSELIP